MLPPTFITFQSHWSLFVFLASYLYIPHFIQSTVCENSDVCPLHPSRLIASLLLTHFKTDRTFLIYQIFFYLFIFFPVRVPPSLALSRGVCLFVREREQWGSEEKMVIARREDHSNAASPWNSCASLWASASRTDAHMTRFFISPLHFFFPHIKAYSSERACLKPRIGAKRLMGSRMTWEAICFHELRSRGRRLNCLFGIQGWESLL